MAFGSIMKMQVGDLAIELAPFNREDVSAFIAPGMQQWSVTKYLGRHTAPVLEDEHEWYEKVRTAKDTLVWGVWAIDQGERKLIGTSSIGDITLFPLKRGETGVMIADKAYWGRGIASSIHKARTWYAFDQLGFSCLRSGVIHGNAASLKAVEKVGYVPLYVERNLEFFDGQLKHVDWLECLNPADWSWRRWWGEEAPSESFMLARERTIDAHKWAQQNVELA